MRLIAFFLTASLSLPALAAEKPTFATPPKAAQDARGTRVSFTVSAPTDGRRLCRLDPRGAVPEAKFAFASLWPPKGVLPNSGGGPTHLKASPDGKYLYLSGSYSSKTAYGHVPDPRFPPGQVYRMEVGKDAMEPFAKLPTVGENPAKAGYRWISKHISHPMNYTVPHGPIHGVAADKAGNVYVADQDSQCVAVFDSAAKELGKIDVPYPDLVAVHPATGALYVLTKEIKGYHQYKKSLVKCSGRSPPPRGEEPPRSGGPPAGWKEPKQVALLELGTDAGSMPQMALSAGRDTTVLWLSGRAPGAGDGSGGLIAVEDKGTTWAAW
ncbi:MAG: hypothetical protein FJ290_28560 [Planctomycetes bacterium]|nr:hypothetical protein [Planctomycetota bacterium]